MSTSGLPLLMLLLLAHLLGDFAFQKSSWIDERYEKHIRSSRLYAHAAIHTFLALIALCLLLAPSWPLLANAAVIGATHFVIDLGKSYTRRDQLRWFVVDQVLHLIVISLVWVALTDQWSLLRHSADLALAPEIMLILIAYFVVLWPFSIVIEMVCRVWAKEIEGIGSLANAGKRIGQLERFLVMTFILVDQFAAIGFLLAAKSILRFGDTRETDHRKINEYVLLGTMTSFAITIAFGLIIRRLISVL